MGQFTNSRAKAGKQLLVLSIPNLIVTASTTPVKVGTGNLCRINGTAGGFVRFAKAGDSTAPSSSTPETLQTEEGFFYVISTEDFIIASASMRCEVTVD